MVRDKLSPHGVLGAAYQSMLGLTSHAVSGAPKVKYESLPDMRIPFEQENRNMYWMSRVDLIQGKDKIWVAGYGHCEDHDPHVPIYAAFAKRISGKRYMPGSGKAERGMLSHVLAAIRAETRVKTDGIIYIMPNGTIEGNRNNEVGRKIKAKLEPRRFDFFIDKWKVGDSISPSDMPYKPEAVRLIRDLLRETILEV